MKSIISALIKADSEKNIFIQQQFKNMFIEFGPDQVQNSREVQVVFFGKPSENSNFEETLRSLKNNPEKARKGQYSPFQRTDIEGSMPLKNGQGLYIILTDYEIDGNECKFKIDGLTAVYRGESSEVRGRLMGHIFKDLYIDSLRKNQTPWPSFMAIDNQNGINIHQEPYSNSKWMVVVYRACK